MRIRLFGAAAAFVAAMLCSGAAPAQSQPAPQASASGAAPAAVQAQAPAARAPSPAKGPDAIAPDPNVRRGVLPNGMRYVLMSHNTPAGAVNIRFRFNVGGIVEEDGERGVAHYLEHVAFNGGRAVPAGRMETLFAAQGVAFGKDQNATTSTYETIYRLDLPVGDPATLDLAFTWLRDVADGLSITPESVERERGVILRERDTGLDAQAIHMDNFRDFLEPELRSTHRDAIGTPQTLAALTAPMLRGFYERWYRPENALMVVVGDAPLDELEARVRINFGSWQAKGPAPKRPAASTTDMARKFESKAWPLRPGLWTWTGLCYKRTFAPVGPDTLARAREEAVRDLWQSILNDRLDNLARRADPPFHQAKLEYEDDTFDAASVCLQVMPGGPDWRGSLAYARAELQRFWLYGPTEKELKRAQASRLTVMRFGRDHAEGYANAAYADFILAKVARGDVTASLEERYRAEAATADITATEVRDAFRADWTGGGPILGVLAETPPSEAQMGAAWTRIAAAPDPGPWVAPAEAAWAYADFGPAGRVVSREVITAPDFVRLTFENGLVLNFKQAPFASNQVTVTASLAAERGVYQGLSPYAAAVSAQALPAGGLGKNSLDEVRRLFSDRVWSADVRVRAHNVDLVGQTAATDIGVQLEILAALVTDPGFRGDMDADIGTTISDLYANARTQPAWAASTAAYRAIAPDGPLTLPPSESLDNFAAADVKKVFRPILTEAPIELSIVGDVSEAAVVEAVARTFGALPARKPKAPPRATFMHYPARSPAPIRVSYDAPAPRAAVVVMYPLYVGSIPRRREERALILMNDMFGNALRHRLREAMSDTYSPSTNIDIEDDYDQGVLTVYVECTPERADKVLEAINAVAADYAAGRIEPDELEAVRKPVLASAKDRQRDLDWWVNTLNDSKRDPAVLQDARSWDAAYGSITIDEIKAVARTWLSRPGIASIASPPAAGGTSRAAPAAGAK